MVLLAAIVQQTVSSDLVVLSIFPSPKAPGQSCSLTGVFWSWRTDVSLLHMSVSVGFWWELGGVLTPQDECCLQVSQSVTLIVCSHRREYYTLWIYLLLLLHPSIVDIGIWRLHCICVLRFGLEIYVSMKLRTGSTLCTTPSSAAFRLDIVSV